MGRLVIVCVALFSICLNVVAKDVSVKTVNLKTNPLGEIYYAIPSNQSSELGACFLQKPDGIVYELFPFKEANLTDSNITFVSTITHHCGIEIKNVSDNYTGQWVLKSNALHFFNETEAVSHLLNIAFHNAYTISMPLTWVFYFIGITGLIIIMVSLVRRTKMAARLKHRAQSFRDKNENKCPSENVASESTA